MKINFLSQIYVSFLICLFAQSCADTNTYNEVSTSGNDSITDWVKASKNENYTLNTRKQLLEKSYRKILESAPSNIDTSQLRNLSTIAWRNFKLGDTVRFKNQNKDILILAEKLRDSFTIGDVHWNYASYYNQIEAYDSSFYHFNLAYRYFKKDVYVYESAQMLYGMAYIKGRYNDYSGSEVLTFKAISKFEKINNYELLYSCYNHLALLENDIQDFDRALFYHNKALEYLDDIPKNRFLIQETLNNIGNSYLKKGDYREALIYFEKVLDDNRLKSKNEDQYARVLSNRAYCKLLMRDTVNVANHLKEGLKIRERLNNKSGIVVSKLYLAQYYGFKQDTMAAITNAKEAMMISGEIKNGGDYLKSLSLLARLDDKHSLEYFKNYVQFNDSLQIVERQIQNKFTRIAYETDEYIRETERLSEEKIWILAMSVGLLLIFVLLFLIKIQKSRTEKLLLENKQQKANEQIYLITLRQQEKLEKEKNNERNRIAEELHDGILSKLFGTRISLGFLDIEGGESLKQEYENFLNELQNIEKEIREVSHKLSVNFEHSQTSYITIISQLIEKNSVLGNFEYELLLDENLNWQMIDEIVKVNLYRVLQEALQNIIKYASADNVFFSFSLNNRVLSAIIKDDGNGFHLKYNRKGIGIKNMKSRVEKLNGTFYIDSKKDRGTTIEIKIPI